MYFKIENKESELYKNVFAYIEKRRKQQTDNYEAVDKFLGKTFTDFLRWDSGFNCVTPICGVVYQGEIDGMKRDKDNNDCLVPNRRTKRGREIQDFIDRLPNWSYKRELELFPIGNKNSLRSFLLPWVEEFDGIICARIDDQHKPIASEDFVEITTGEFNKITGNN